MGQRILTARDHYAELDQWIEETGAKKTLLVCGGSIRLQKAFIKHVEKLEESGLEIVVFHDFQPNPLYENVLDGVKLFRKERCGAIMAVGGGSAMDVAKCVKAYAAMSGGGEGGGFLGHEIKRNAIPFLAVPTTAGSGSEATRYAAIYHGGEKRSVAGESLVPDAVLMDPGMLRTLPPYQRKSAMMDALCHAVESFWSVNSTAESREYGRRAIRGVIGNMDGYLAGIGECGSNMLWAANAAGRAINIAQTTAGHAMCYKITSLFGLAHGHAAILCDRILFPWMMENADKCVDPRGKGHLEKMMDEIGRAMGCEDARGGARKLASIFDSLGFDVPAATAGQYRELAASVNPVRLKNHPIGLDAAAIDELYHKILR